MGAFDTAATNADGAGAATVAAPVAELRPAAEPEYLATGFVGEDGGATAAGFRRTSVAAGTFDTAAAANADEAGVIGAGPGAAAAAAAVEFRPPADPEYLATGFVREDGGAAAAGFGLTAVAAAGAFDTAAANGVGVTLDEAATPPAIDNCAFLLLTAVAPTEGGCSFHDLAALLLPLLPALIAGATPRESDRAGPPAVSPLPTAVAFVHTRLWPGPLRGCAAGAPSRNAAAGVLGGGGRPTGFFVATLPVPAILAVVLLLLVHTRLRLPALDFVLMTAWPALPLARAGVVWRVALLGPLLGPPVSALTQTRFPPALGAAPGTGEGEAAPGTWETAAAPGLSGGTGGGVLFQDMLLPRPRPRDAGNVRPPLPAAAASPPRPLPPEYVSSTIFFSDKAMKRCVLQ